MANFDFGIGDYEKAQKKINDMYNQQKTAKITEYTNARNKAVGELNNQKKEIIPTFQAKRNEADVVNRQNVQALRESMAVNGLLSSGENVSAQVGLGAARQNALNDINVEQQNTERDFATRLSALNDPGEQNRVIQEIETLRSQALLEAYNRQQQLAYQKRMDDLAEQWRKKEWDYRERQDRRSGGGRGGSGGGGGGSYASAPSATTAASSPTSDDWNKYMVAYSNAQKKAYPGSIFPNVGSEAYRNKMKRLMP
jgi:hypothetical protein